MSASPLRVFKNPNYRVYFVGQLISMSGTWTQSVAESWLVYRLTHSGYWLGVIMFTLNLTAFAFSPIAGVVADSFNRRKILVTTQTVSIAQALLLAVLVLTHTVQIWHVVALAAVLGFVNAFDITTRHAFAIDMVGKEELSSAIVLNSVVINISRVIGPAIAGVLIGAVGEGWCFAINGLSTIPVVIALATMDVRHTRRNADGQPKNSVLRNIIEGMGYAARTPAIMRLLVVSGVVCLVATPIGVLLPIIAKATLGGDSRTMALLTSAMGVGAVAGAFRGANLTAIDEIRRKIARYILLWGLALVLLGSARHAAVASAAMFLLGYFMMRVFPTMNNAIQHSVHDNMRGRVMALYTMTFLGTMPFGSLAMGWLADHFTASYVCMGSGVLTALIGLALFPRYFWRVQGPVSSPQAS